MSIIRQSTARTILVGPILDSLGAAKTDEVVASIKVTKNGTAGAIHPSATLTHDHAGKYRLAYTATDSDTVGLLEFSLNSGTNDMPIVRLCVVEEAVYDISFAASATGQVPLQAGTGTGQLDFTSGVVKANVTQYGGSAGTFASGRPEVNVVQVNGSTQGATGLATIGTAYDSAGYIGVNVLRWLGTAVSTPTVAGVPNVNVKTWNDLTTVALPLVPTTAGRTLDVSATGEAGIDWANVGSPTTTVGLSGTTIATSQVVASVSGAVGSVTGLTASNLDATISSRMATAGYTAPLDAAGVRDAVGLNSANLAALIGTPNNDLATDIADANGQLSGVSDGIVTLQASVNDLPTNAELATALGNSDDATLAAIAALNNVSAAEVVTAMGTGSFLTAIPWNAAWDAEVQSEAADALTAYGPATPGSAMTLADGAITAAKIAADALAAAKLAVDACEKIADILLRRTMANVEGSSNGDALSVNSLYGAVQQAQESAISGATQTIKKTDGATTLGTKTISTSAGADPIRGIS
jgi:hypothetical protein